jgi:DNA repair protein RadA/Sms
MGGAGLEAVANPSELFLAERRAGAPGSCIVPWLEGSRPMLVEIQALVAPAGYGTARRTAIGVDDARLALLLAVLDRRARVDLLSRDVYVNAVGGVRIREPGADLALALALASSRLDLALPADAAACGEVGLGGEIRRVARSTKRASPRRRGSASGRSDSGGRRAGCLRRAARLVPVGDLAEAVAWLFVDGRSRLARSLTTRNLLIILRFSLTAAGRGSLRSDVTQRSPAAAAAAYAAAMERP